MSITISNQHDEKSPLFSRLKVADAMRNQVLFQSPNATIGNAIRTVIKNKADGLLITDQKRKPVGVITKTEVMGAYYAEMPIFTELGDIMGSPVISCSPEDTLESALITMQQAKIHRIYVIDSSGSAIGTLSYPDIVGTLYKYCHNCDYGLRKKTSKSQNKIRFTINEVMTPSVEISFESDQIMTIIEKITACHIGAILILNELQKPVGVISKTDLTLAYCRAVPLSSPARLIMKSPVTSCSSGLPLEEGIRIMIFAEISRLFVHDNEPHNIMGVLNLSDAARTRSGSCQACTSSRITIKEQ